MFQRAVLIGLPRSGTTWMANTLGAHPAVHLMYEPDNRNLDVLGWLGTGVVGRIPALDVGASAPDYRRMWQVAFAGGWPERGVLRRVVGPLRQAATAGALPRTVRVASLRAAAAVGSRRRPPAPVVLVKSVAAQLSVDWIAAEFDPLMIVVWRHPLNVVASWLTLGWSGIAFIIENRTVRARFEGTSLWPPPTGNVVETAWSVCAELTILLESAQRQPRALVLNHERSALDPIAAATDALRHIGLRWDEGVGAAVRASDRPGEGWVAERLAAEEPTRWRARLSASDAKQVAEVVDRFQSESTVVADAWPCSPAVVG